MTNEERKSYQKAYNDAHKEEKNIWDQTHKEQKRNYHYISKYGISLEQYNHMLIAQNGKCAICVKEETVLSNNGKDIQRLCIDHDHMTGKVRQLLCNACNTALGKINEDIEILSNMIKYLNKWK